MRVAVVDVAAEKGGALSVLNDFVEVLTATEDKENEWFIITSVVSTCENDNIHNIQFPETKASWLHRLWWEHAKLPKLLEDLRIDIVVSMQNNGLPIKESIRQIVYFHNILFIQNDYNFSFRKKPERIYAVYSKILAPYIRHSWKKADVIVVQGHSMKEQLSAYFPKNRIYICEPEVKTNQVNEKTRHKIKGFLYPASALVYKNMEVIVEAIKRMEQKGESVEVLFTISGTENQYAKKISDMAKFTKGIKLIGYQDRQSILKKYQAYGLIITSRLESFGMPIAEAMTCQTVVVALDMPYVRDQIETSHYNRAYIAKNDPDDLAKTMQFALRDEKEGNYHVNDKKNGGMHHMIHIIKEMRE